MGLTVSEPRIKNPALLSHVRAVSNSCPLSELALGLPISVLIQRLRRYLNGGESRWQVIETGLTQHQTCQVCSS